MSSPKNYVEWLEQQNREVTPTQYASHMHLLRLLPAAIQSLKDVLRDHAGPPSFPATKFSVADTEVLEKALHILKSVEIPQVTLRVKEEKPIRRPRMSYDRRIG